MSRPILFALMVVMAWSLPVWGQESASSRIVMICSGNAEAVLEPCGCKGDDLGGLDVRAKKIGDILNESYPTIVMENCGAFDSGTMLDKVRTEEYLELLQKLSYDCLHIGENEIVLGPKFIQEQSEKLSYPFLSSNLRLGVQGTPWWKTSLVKELDGWKVGVIGLMPSVEKPDEPEGIFWSEPPLAIAQEMAAKLKSEEKVDVLVLLSGLSVEVETEVASQVPGIDVIVTNNPGTPYGTIPGTNTICLRCKHQSKTINRLDIGRKPDTGALGYIYKEIMLRRPEGSDDEMLQAIRAFYARLLADPKYGAKAADPLADLEMERSGKYTYVGAESCKECHPDIHRYWSARTHRYAYRTLVKKQAYYYPECIGCHVTGFKSESGFKVVDPNGAMAGVQCESCHGPASAHVAEPEKTKPRIEKSKEFCARCHTEEYTPDFDRKYKNYYKSYFPHVPKK